MAVWDRDDTSRKDCRADELAVLIQRFQPVDSNRPGVSPEAALVRTLRYGDRRAVCVDDGLGAFNQSVQPPEYSNVFLIAHLQCIAQPVGTPFVAGVFGGQQGQQGVTDIQNGA